MNIDRDHFKTFSAGLVMGLLVAGGLCAWNTLNRITNPSVLAPVAKELAKEKTETLTCKPVVVYRDKVKEKLNLPETVVKDPDKKVTASTKVPASEFPNTVTSIYDSGTGATDLYIRRDPMPWIGTASRGSVGLHGGIQEDGETVGRLSASYSRLQVKRLNLDITGDIATSGRKFIGVGGEIRF